MVKLGFIGFGEAAYEMSRGFRSENKDLEIRAYDIAYNSKPDFFNKRAKDLNVIIAKNLEDLITNSEIIISVVPTAFTLSTAKGAIPFFKEGQLFADASTSLPSDMVEVAEIARKSKIDFADVAMLGSLPKDKHKVPILVSGIGSEKFLKLMKPQGMVIEKVSDIAGDASAIKLTRSIFMKGLATLITETLLCAHKNNIEPQIISSISESLDGEKFIDTANRLVTGNAIHSERRIHEMEGVIQFTSESGIIPNMSEATKKSLEFINNLELNAYFKGVKPKNYFEVIKAIDEKCVSN